MIDVKDTDKGKVVTFIVVERPPVSAIYIAGNKKVKIADIRDKLKIKSGSVLNIEKVKESVEEIKKLYAGKGYYASKVSYEIDTKEGYKAGSQICHRGTPRGRSCGKLLLPATNTSRQA